MLRIGLVGRGPWASKYIATVNNTGRAQIAAVATRDWRDIVPRVDGLIAAATPEAHVEVAAHCLEHRVPLLVEKPLGLDPIPMHRLITLADSPHCPPLHVNHVLLRSSAFRALKQALVGQPIRSIAAIGENSGPVRAWSPLFDYGPHDVAMCLELVPGDFELVASQRRETSTGTLYSATFKLGQVVVDMRVGNGATEKTRRLSVSTDRGTYVLEADQLLLNGQVLAPRQEPPLDTAVREFLDDVQVYRSGDSCAPRTIHELTLTRRVLQVLSSIGR